MTDIKKWNIKKLILFQGGVETLSYFSFRLAEAFEKLGYEVFIFDLKKDVEDYARLLWFCEAYETAMVTFNFIGISGEKIFEINNGGTFWDHRNILCLNIVVDHPFYYHKPLTNPPLHYIQFCIDRLHISYMKKFFPNISKVSFLPLAGTQVCEDFQPYHKREIDLLFTGNYTEPKKFESYITGSGKEYEDFYRSIITDLLEHTFMPVDKAIEGHIRAELGEVSKDDMKSCMKNMIFIDLYVRFYFRGLIIKTLVDNGIKVHVLGAGWDKLDCIHKENLVNGGSVDSFTCIRQMGNAKISLNIMPWLKDGAHDRIFNTMLSKSVSLSDSSAYIDELFLDRKEIMLYSLERISELPQHVLYLLEYPKLAEEIAEAGYRKAGKYHTWEHRAYELDKYMKSYGVPLLP